MAKMGRKSPWELALEDPHLMRLGDFLAIQMGKEALARLELELDLEWCGGGQEAIRRRLEGEYLTDQEDQWSPFWSHWRSQWEDKPKIVKIVDENYLARPFIIMHTSKDQSHASCPLSCVTKKDVNITCSDKESLRDGVPGQMEEKLGSDDEERASYKSWEEHEKWGQMKEMFSWKTNNKQLVQAETCDDQNKTPSNGKMVKKMEELNSHICTEEVTEEVRKILMSSSKSKSGGNKSKRKHNECVMKGQEKSGWQSPRPLVSEEPQKKKHKEKKYRERKDNTKNNKTNNGEQKKSNDMETKGGKEEVNMHYNSKKVKTFVEGAKTQIFIENKEKGRKKVQDTEQTGEKQHTLIGGAGNGQGKCLLAEQVMDGVRRAES